jgi:hypothetical protein
MNGYKALTDIQREYEDKMKKSLEDLLIWADTIAEMFKKYEDVDEWERELDIFRPKIEADGIHFDYTGNFSVILMLPDYVTNELHFLDIAPNGKKTLKLVKIWRKLELL